MKLKSLILLTSLLVISGCGSSEPAVTPSKPVTPSVKPTEPVTPSVSPTHSVEPTPSTTEVSPSPSETPTPSGVTPTGGEVTPTPSATPTPTAPVTPTPSETPVPSVSPTPSFSPTPTVEPSPSAPVTPTPTPTPTPTEVDDYGYDHYDGYYGELKWDDSKDLINKLHDIISNGYTPLKYEGNWDTNKGADQAYDDLEMVDILYSKNNDLKTNTYSGGKGWQREHAFAASLMTGFTSGDAVGVHKGRATDFHNLFAASYSGNTSRGNKNFGIANTEDPGYIVGDDYTSDPKNFEPSDYDKGRLSRAIFYMAVMYNQEEQETVKVTLNYNSEDQETYGKKSTSVPIEVTYKPLSIVEDYVGYSKITYTNWYYQTSEDIQALVAQYGEGAEGYARYSEDNCQFAIGNLSTLLSWNSYTVDLLETQHNEYVYSTSGQGNRNPFVDYPELVSYAFGENKDQPGDLKHIRPSEIDLGIDGDDNDIHHYAIKSANREFGVGDVFSKDEYSLVSITNAFKEAPIDFTDETKNYTFTDEDAANGGKTITINTPKNNIGLKVKVTGSSINSCNYIYEIEGSAKGKDFNGYTKGSNILLGSINWIFDWTGATGKIGSKDSTYGLAFGVKTNTQTMKELTMKTVDELKVNHIVFKGIGAAGSTIDYHFYVGDELVKEGSIVRDSKTTEPAIVEWVSASSKTGVVRIVIDGSGASSGAIYVHTLALNIVE